MADTLSYATHDDRDRRPLIAWLAAVYPVAWMAAVYASAASTRLSLGYWPQSPVDDPALPVLHYLAMILMLGIPFALGASIGLGLRPLFDGFSAHRVAPRRWLAYRIALPLATWGLTAALIASDHRSVWTWYFD